jgi:uncharacterized protein (DUF2062 family)
MLFKRREAEGWLWWLRVQLWPRRSWARSSRYVAYRIRRISASPHAIALGFAAGAFAAVTPFLGTHLIMAAVIAWMVGGSIVAALLGTFIGNPLTYPLFWYSTYEAGNLMLGKEAEAHPIDLSEGIFKMSVDQLWPILKPMSLGSIPIGFGIAVLSYFVVKVMVEAYQRRRRELRAREESEALGTQ